MTLEGGAAPPIRDLDAEAAERGKALFELLLDAGIIRVPYRAPKRYLLLTTAWDEPGFDPVKAWVKPEAQPEQPVDISWRLGMHL